MSENATCATCGRQVERDHCWPCLVNENAVLRQERDEARNVAKRLFSGKTDAFSLLAYPWLADVELNR